MQASLGYFLYTLHIKTLEDPLEDSSLTLPDEWGVIAGWCLASFPLLPLVIGALGSSIRKIRGRAPFKVRLVFRNPILIMLEKIDYLTQIIDFSV